MSNADEDRSLNELLYRLDHNGPETKNYSWSADYGRDLLVDINHLAHYRGTTAITRDCLQRAFSEITRLRKQLADQLPRR